MKRLWCRLAHGRYRDELWEDLGHAMPLLLLAWRCRRCGTSEGHPEPGKHVWINYGGGEMPDEVRLMVKR